MTDDEHQKLQDAVDTLRSVGLAVESPVICLDAAVGDNPENVDSPQVRRSLRALRSNIHVLLECLDEVEQEVESVLPKVWDVIREAYAQESKIKAILGHRRNLGSSFPDAKREVESRAFEENWTRADDE